MTYPGSGGEWSPQQGGEQQWQGGWQGGAPQQPQGPQQPGPYPAGPQPTAPYQNPAGPYQPAPYQQTAPYQAGPNQAGPQPTAPYPGGTQPYPGQPHPGQPNQGGQPYPGDPSAHQAPQQFGMPPRPPQSPFLEQQFAEQQPLGAATYWQPPKPKSSHKGLVLGLVVAVVVLAGGGAGTWYALNRTADSGATGSATPQAAATKLLADVGNADVIGVVNDLPPAEASLLRDTITDTTQQLKRLQVVKPDVDPQQPGGVSVHASGITFDPSGVQQVNDHLAIAKLVGGTITINADMAKFGYTDQFLKSAFPNGAPADSTQTLNIADAVRQLGHPIRIATVAVNGKWYPSLFYSIADAGLQAAHLNWPASGIPAAGAVSADAAVREFAQALLDADFSKAIALTAPDEMAALHDAGPAIVNAAGDTPATGVKIDSATFADRSVAGGVDAVVSSVTLEYQGDQLTVSESGGCLTIQDQASGDQQKQCADDIAADMRQGAGGDDLPPVLTKFFQDLSDGIMNSGIGIVATQVDGQWYVSPGRTVSELSTNVFSSINAADFSALLQAGH
jgi:hypothetical protein